MNQSISKAPSSKWLGLVLIAAFIASTAPANAQSNETKLSSEELLKAKATLEVIHGKLVRVSKINSQIQLVESDDIDIQINTTDKPIITLSSGLIWHFRDDRDAVAGLIARQQASLIKKPAPKQDAKKSPTLSRLLDMVGSAVGSAVDSKVGVSGVAQTVAEGSSEIADSLASQAKEKQIEENSVNWMLEAGYNPYGAVRAQKALSALPEGSKGQTLAASPERSAYLEALIDDNAKAKTLATEGKTALLTRTQAANKSSEGAKPPSSAGQQTAVAPASASNAATPNDEPIDGVSLSRYATIKNDIAYKGETEALAKHKLSAEAFANIDQQWSARITQDKKLQLSTRYARHYMEASQGEFADWGRDVAQVKQTGRLQLGTDPTGVDDWVALHKAQKEAAAGGPDAASDFRKTAKDKGLTDYDFHIVNAWWLQRAKDKAAQGDNSLLQRIN